MQDGGDFFILAGELVQIGLHSAFLGELAQHMQVPVHIVAQHHHLFVLRAQAFVARDGHGVALSHLLRLHAAFQFLARQPGYGGYRRGPPPRWMSGARGNT